MPNTVIMQVRTEDIMIERIVQYTWMILGMDDSTLKLLTYEQVSRKKRGRVDCHLESVDNN